MADIGAPSYGDILQCCGVSNEAMKIKCPDDALRAIAGEMNEWRTIELGIKRGKVTSLKMESGADEEKRYEYLQCWNQKYGPMATFELLARRFVDAGRADLAGFVCEERKKRGLPAAHPGHSGAAPDLMSPGRAKPFVATASEDELSSLTRDVAASHSAQIDRGDMQVPIPASSSSPRGSEDSINTGAGVLQEESSECKSSYMLPGTAVPPSSSSNAPSPPEKAQTETEAGWLRSQVTAEKEEKKVIQSKLDELNKRKEKLERRLFVKSKECEKLENEAQSTKKELNDEQKKYDDAMQELRARKDEIKSLKQSLQVKDGELKLEQKLRAKQEIAELNTVLDEISKRIRELKEDWKKDRREVNEVREDKSIIEKYLSWADKDVKYYKEVEKRIKSLETQRTVAVVAFVVFIIPLVLAHVILVM